MAELVNTNCPNCGASIQVNPDYPNKMFCQYCGTSFMVKDVIHNHVVINNYNDVSLNTIGGILGKRESILGEVKKEKEYFLEKELLYNSVSQLKDTEIPLCDTQKNKEVGAISWRNIIGVLLIIICSTANVFFLLYAFMENNWIGAIITFAGLAGGIVLVTFYNNDKSKILKKYGDRKKELIELADKNEKELLEYYNAYGTCLVGFEYTFPRKIKAIYELIESGKAETTKDAINIMDSANDSVETYADKLLDKYKLSNWNEMLKEYCNNTGFDLPKGAAILRERAKLKHLM